MVSNTTVNECKMHADSFTELLGHALEPAGITIKCFATEQPYSAQVVSQWFEGEEMCCQTIIRIKESDDVMRRLLVKFLKAECKRVETMV